MRILNIKIKEYGALCDRSFNLEDGINVFEGNNESGKSTVLSFIKFIFYGMQRRGAGEVLSDRDRYLSWKNGVAEGSLTLESDGATYRIERRGALSNVGAKESYRESVRIIDLSEGTAVLSGVVPGEHFLGMPLSVFESTACLKQLEASEIKSEDVNSAIENILFSANESTNTQKAVDRLESARKPMLHKNEKGGKLFELAIEKSTLESRLIDAKRTTEEIGKKSAEVDKLRENIAALSHTLGVIDAKRRRTETLAILKRFDELHACEEDIKRLDEAYQNLKKEFEFTDAALPSRSDAKRLAELRETISTDESQKAKEEFELRTIKDHDTADRRLAAYAPKIREMGDKHTVCDRVARLIRARSLTVAFGAACLSLGIVAAVSAIPLYLINLPILSFVLLGVGGSSLIAGIILLCLIKKRSSATVNYLSEIGINNAKIKKHELAFYIDECFRHELLANTCDLKVSAINQNLRALESSLRDITEEATAILEKFSKDAPPDSESLKSVISLTSDQIISFCNRKDEIVGEVENKKRLIQMLSPSLTEYNEASLRAKMPSGSDDGDESVDELDNLYSFNHGKMKALDAKRIELEKELMVLEKTSENPAHLSSELELLEKDYVETKLYTDALILAKETIENASLSLRSSVTPRIRERAGHYLSLLSSGKYTEIGINKEMKISITADDSTHTIEAMSKGTKDAAYIALRLALLDYVSTIEHTPLLLDEALSQLDNQRAANALGMLNVYANDGNQVIMFTCHTRESEILESTTEYNKISL